MLAQVDAPGGGVGEVGPSRWPPRSSRALPQLPEGGPACVPRKQPKPRGPVTLYRVPSEAGAQ